MKSCRLVAVLLVLCLMVSFLGVTAWAQEIPAIQSGGTVTFSTTKSNHVVYYSFTPQTSGTYVLYDLGDCAFQSWLSVHTCAPTDAAFDQQQVTKGLNQVIFQAEAGVTCWLKLDCAWVGGGELSHSFKLASVSAATDISIGHVSLASNEVGSEGRLYLKYEPMGSGEQVVWSTSDSRVAVVEGDANSAKFRLNGPGTATITASTASGLTAQYEVDDGVAQYEVDFRQGDYDYDYEIDAVTGKV
ncbi:MAG: PepSY domain-containing protein, partial [Oscillospiraceae bacterium]|nr:PepSY domain-containing protein [Oscillospiraceae bacterium]